MKRGRRTGEKEEKKRTNLGTRRSVAPEGQRETRGFGGREKGERGRAAREKGETARGATKVAVTLYKASKPNERGPKGKKTRRSALRGNVEGNGGVHEGEARMDEGRRWQGCKAEAVVPRAPFAFRVNDVISWK